MNLEFLQTQTCNLIAVLCGHKHWRYFQSHQQEKQQLMAQRGKHQEVGSYYLFCFTFPISKLKINMWSNVLGYLQIYVKEPKGATWKDSSQSPHFKTI